MDPQNSVDSHRSDSDKARTASAADSSEAWDSSLPPAVREYLAAVRS